MVEAEPFIGYTGFVCVAFNRLIAETTRKGERLETLKRLGHYFTPAFICVLPVMGIVPLIVDNEVTTWILNLTVFVVVALLAFHLIAHRGKLCERCLNIPLNPSGAAESKDRWLKLFHWEMDGPVYAPLSIPVGGVLLAVASRYAINSMAGNIVWLLLFAIPTTGSFYAMWVHHRLQPWCTYCRRGGRGKREGKWEPTPDPSVSR